MPKMTVKDFRKQVDVMIGELQKPMQPPPLPEINPIDKLIELTKKQEPRL